MSAEPVTLADAEPADLLVRNLGVAGQLLASATAFFFLAFLFAYVYLRALNSDGQWHPKNVHPPVGTGTVVAALLVLSAVAVQLASADERAGRLAARAPKLGAGFVLGLAALVVQVVEWGTVGFGPADGGYASVFVGWTGFYFAFALLTLCWLEIQLASALRRRSEPLPGLAAFSFYWTFLVGVGLLSWVVLYLVTP